MEFVKRAQTERSRALDGLRGVAALVVLVGHVLNYTPIVEYRGLLHADGWARWWSNTPVQMMFDGPDAVLVFFVLSGFVLLPNGARSRRAWLAYYPSRLVRLMVPAMASVVFALGVLSFSDSWVEATVRSVARDLILLKGTDDLNGPLWSLQWELWFSLALPVYTVLARWRPRLVAVKAGVVLGIALVGLVERQPAVFYLSVFALGSLLAVEYRDGTTVRFFNRLGQHRGAVAGLTVVIVVAFNSRALLAFPGEPSARAVQFSGISVVLGAVGIVVLTLHVSRLRRVLESPLAQWLGMRSFSIYLIHWPLVEFVHSRVGETAAGWPVVLALPLSIAAGEAFYRVVEHPAHLLARRVNAGVTRRAASHESQRIAAGST